MNSQMNAYCPFQCSPSNFQKYIMNSKNTQNQLFQIIRRCQTNNLKIRFNIWRLLLGVIKFDSDWNVKVEQIEQSRKRYESLNQKHSKKQQKKQIVPQKPAINNPLNKNPLGQLLKPKPVNNVSQQQSIADDKFLHQEIAKDVQRTYQQKPFFTQNYISKLLTQVLFIWCKQNPDISYKQGMNQIGASVIYVYFMSAVDRNINYEQLEVVNQQFKQKYLFANSKEYAQADIYNVFEKLMNYGHKQMFRLQNQKQKTNLNPNSKNNNPILIRITKLSDVTLKNVDLELFRHIKLLQVQMRTFLLRWIRCLHTRQFQLENSFLIWDNIFLQNYEAPIKTGDFVFVDYVCLAMLIYLRDLAMTKQRTYQILQLYQKYPKVEGKYLEQLMNLAWTIKQIVQNAVENGPNQVVQKKKKDLFLLDKGFTEKIQKQEIQQKKQKNKKNQLPAMNEKDLDKQIYPIFHKKSNNQTQAHSSQSPIKNTENNIYPKLPELTNQVKIEPIQQRKKQSNETQSPMVIPQKKNPLHFQQMTQQNTQQINSKPVQKIVISSRPSQDAQKKYDFNITLSYKEWKQIQTNLKKSIDQNTDIDSKSLSQKVLKILQNKQQEEIKKLNVSNNFLPQKKVVSQQQEKAIITNNVTSQKKQQGAKFKLQFNKTVDTNYNIFKKS